MQNRRTLYGTAVFLAALIQVMALSCSSVFTSSISGTIIDAEAYEDGTTTGIADTKVFLYTDEEAWTADYAAFVEGNEATLPDSADSALNPSIDYFQSTVTDANGDYQFSGFIWDTLFPKYGKTADRRQIYLLIYNRDYGLWKNPVPLFVVSDVTAQLDMIKITNLWNEGRMAGRVLNWKDGKGLGGVSVNFYIAESWSFDPASATPDAFTNVKYPQTATSSVTTNTEGQWTADLRFPIKPTRALDKGKAPVKITFTRADYRLNSVTPYTGFSNPASLVTNEDLNRNGRKADEATAIDDDWADAYLPGVIEMTTDSAPLTTIADIMMQRWRFSTTVNGRVHDGAPTATRIYLNGREVTLTIVQSNVVYKDISSSQTVGETTTHGHINFGTVEWFMGDIAAVIAEQKSGKASINILIDTLSPNLGDKTTIEPDVTLTLDLVP